MNNSFARLIDGMCATLRTEVLTRLDDEFARGQVYGVINLLNTFKVRADWSTEFLLAQVKAQEQALGTVQELLQGARHSPPVARIAPVHGGSATELWALRDAHNQSIGQLLNWLDEQQGKLDASVAAQIEQALRQALRREIELELKYSPRPLFAEMSSGQEH